MHRELRRKDRAITVEEARAILEKGEYGVLATVDAKGEPYGVPISYVFMNDAIYIHCAMEGEKLDNIMQNPAVSFTVVGFVEAVGGQPGLSTYYESCIVFGSIRDVTDGNEKVAALKALTMKYLPAFMDVYEVEIQKEKIIKVFAIPLTRITGKSKKKPA